MTNDRRWWLRIPVALAAAWLVQSCSASSDEDTEPFTVPYRATGCGNGVREGDEACDGVDLGGATCASASMSDRARGSLSCTETCDLDVSGCESSTGGRSNGDPGSGGR